jgi:ATP synthase protein I
MLPANLTRLDGWSDPGEGVAVTGGEKPEETGGTGPGHDDRSGAADRELERRRQSLEASLAAKGRDGGGGGNGARSLSTAGYGQALRLSSEFIAGVAVGAGLGWFVDRLAGTSPWGLIVFLLLGFGAGVLNILRSAGMVAEAGIRAEKRPEDSQK